MINRVERYETMGKEFPTLEKAVEYREGLIEEFLRKSPGFQDMPARARTAFVEHILKHREGLAKLFDYPNTLKD